MTTAWSTRAKQRLNADRQRLERAKDHLRLDKEHMDAENTELNKEILEKTKEYQARKEELLEERGLLQVREQPGRAREARGECAKSDGRGKGREKTSSSVPRVPLASRARPISPFSSFLQRLLRGLWSTLAKKCMW